MLISKNRNGLTLGLRILELRFWALNTVKTEKNGKNTFIGKYLENSSIIFFESFPGHEPYLDEFSRKRSEIRVPFFMNLEP